MRVLTHLASIGFALVATLTLTGCARSADVPPKTQGASPELVLKLGHSGAVNALAYSPDGSILASAGDDKIIRLSDARTGELQQTLPGNRVSVQSLKYSPDGVLLAVRGRDRTYNGGGELMLVNSRTGALQHTWSNRDQISSDNGIMAFAFTPDSHTIALSSWNLGKQQDQVTLWDIGSGKQKGTITTSNKRTRAMAFSHDGKTIAIARENGLLQLWDIATHRLKRTIQSKNSPTLKARNSGLYTVAFAPNDKTLVASGVFSEEMTAATVLWLWDVATGKLKQTMVQAGGGIEVEFSHDGKTLVSAGSMLGVAIIVFWDVATGKEKRALNGITGFFFPIALSPDGKTLATGNMDGTSTASAFSNAWQDCIGDIQLWNVATGKVRHTLKGQIQSPIRAVSIAPDGSRYATVSTDPTQQQNSPARSVRLWVAHNGRLQSTLQGDEPIAFSTDGKVLAMSDEVPHVRQKLNRKRVEPYWDDNTGSMKGDIEPDFDDVLALRDTATGKLLRNLKVAPYTAPTAIAFSPDGTTMAAQYYGEKQGVIRLWDVASGKVIRTMKTHIAESGGAFLAFSSDGQFIANVWQISGRPDADAVQIWDVNSGKIKLALKTGKLPANAGTERILSVGFLPDGKTLIARSISFLLFWDIMTGQRTRLIKTQGYDAFYDSETHDVLEKGRAPLAISPDGKIIATETDEYSIKLWDAQTGVLLREIKGHESGVLSLAFSPDGKVLINGSNDSTLKFWNTQSGELLLTIMMIGVSKTKVGTKTDWISFTPEGYYDGSVGIEKFIRWRVGDELFPVAKFQTAMRRPDLIAQILSAPR